MPWLMKAEPDSRIVKGKDVKFSVDDFEKIGVSPWDGVRNHEAKKIMKERMKLGDLVLFYHSNTKVPGVFALAVVEKEGYPDYTAWDPSHPYFDPKSSEQSPTWYMVNVKFVRRLAHPVTLSFIKSLVGLSAPPPGAEYIGTAGLKAIQGMALVNRGRLSVQPVEVDAYDAIVALGDKGGWEEAAGKGKGKKPTAAAKAEKPVKAKAEKRAKEESDEEEDDEVMPAKKKRGEASATTKPATEAKPITAKTKAATIPKAEAKSKPKVETKPAAEGTRRSSRIRK